MTVRNNEDRVGAVQPSPPPPSLEQPAQRESTFSFTTPTEFVELPSGGKYYPGGHPLHGTDTLEIRYMTAKDEDILTSRSLLKKGVAIERMLENILVDKSIKVDDLLVGDKNALIVAARITGYGEEYETKTTCPACIETVNYMFDLTQKKLNSGGELESSNVMETESGTFTIELPVSKINLEVRFLTGRDEKKLAQISERRKKHNLSEAILTDQFKLMIVSVNGESNTEIVASFVDAMPAQDSRHLRLMYSTIMPNIALDQSFTCSSCGYEEEVDVPFTADFFWPRR
jgi:hypothetical protein